MIKTVNNSAIHSAHTMIDYNNNNNNNIDVYNVSQQRGSLYCPQPRRPTSPTSNFKRRSRRESTDEGRAASEEIKMIMSSFRIMSNHTVYEKDETPVIERNFDLSASTDSISCNDDELENSLEEEIPFTSFKSSSTSNLRLFLNPDFDEIGVRQFMSPPVRTHNPIPQNTSFCNVHTRRDGSELGLLSFSPPPTSFVNM